MTSSNETFRRSRVFSYLAGGLTALGLVGMGVLVFQVNDLNDRYGQIERDIGYFTDERERLRQSRDQLGQEISRVDIDLQAQREELRRAIQSRTEALVAADTANAARDAAQTTLELLRQQESAAREAIATGERERERIRSLTTQREEIDRLLAELDRRRVDLEQTVSGLRTERTTLGDAVEDLLAQRETETARVEALRAAIVGLEALRQEVELLRSTEADLRQRIATQQAAAGSLESRVSDAQSRLEELQAQLTAETAARDAAARERGLAEGQLGTLRAEVDALSRTSGDLRREEELVAERLRLSEAARQAADEARNQTETTLAEARQALEQVLRDQASALAGRDSAIAERVQVEGDIASGRVVLAEIESAREQIGQLTGQREGLSSEVERLRENRASLAIEIDAANSDLQGLRERLVRLAERAGAAEAAEGEAASRLARLQELIDEAEARATSSNDALAEARQALEAALSERDAAIRVRTQAENDLATLGEELARRQSVLAVVEAAEGQATALSARVESLMETLSARRDEVAQAEAAVQALRADVQRERDEIELLLDRRSVLLSQIRDAEQSLGETQSPAGEIEPPSDDRQ